MWYLIVIPEKTSSTLTYINIRSLLHTRHHNSIKLLYDSSSWSEYFEYLVKKKKKLNCYETSRVMAWRRTDVYFSTVNTCYVHVWCAIILYYHLRPRWTIKSIAVLWWRSVHVVLFGFSAAATGLDICVCMPRIPRNWTKTADDPKTTMGRRFAPKRQKRIFQCIEKKMCSPSPAQAADPRNNTFLYT